MKRLPLVASFLLFIALCASAAYWAMQLFKPPLRPVAAPPRVATADVRPEAATALFGGKAGLVAVASNYQLKGVVFSGSPRDSVAILSADGKPAQAIRANMEVAPGVTVKEVHRDYVLLSEGGATKRVELPESAKGQNGLAMTAPASVAPSPAPSQAVPGRSSVMPPAPVTTAPPTVVVSPPPSAQSRVPGSGPAALPSPVVTPTPVPAAPATPAAPQAYPAPQASSGGTGPAQLPAPAVGSSVPAPTPPAAPALPAVPTQPYAPPASQVPPGTPGPNAPLQSR